MMAAQIPRSSWFHIGVLAVALAGAGACRSGSSPPVAGVSDKPRATDPAQTQVQGPSDAAITDAVLREIVEDPAVAGTDVRIMTTDGIVEIEGMTDNLLSKELATRHAEVIKGVRAVTNRIVVNAPKVPDAELARAAKLALEREYAFAAEGLAVTAKNGVVELDGKVSSYQQRLVADRVVKRTRGVTGVNNGLDVKQEVQRSDEELARDVRARLRWDVLVDHGRIGIDVEDRRVRLHGVVGSAAERTRAEHDAWVNGVEAVDVAALEVDPRLGNDMVRSEKYVIKPNEDVASAIKDAIRHDPRVSTLQIQATVSGGVATLRGSVPTIAARSAADAIARHTVGVLHVNNHLEVTPPAGVADVALEKQLQGALRDNPFTDVYEIAARVEGGKVTLTGRVDSYFEKAEAEAVASSVSGVRAVDNHLVVAKPGIAYVPDPYFSPYHPEIGAAYIGSPKPVKPDAQIETDIRSELRWSPFLRDDRVEISVRNGKATLRGAVDTPREKANAADNALEAGAVTVDNQLEVAPRSR